MKLHPWDRLTKGYELNLFSSFPKAAEASQLPHVGSSHLPLTLLVLGWGCGPDPHNSCFLTPGDCGSSCLITSVATDLGVPLGISSKWCHGRSSVMSLSPLCALGCDAQLSEPLRISRVLWAQVFPIDISAIGFFCTCTTSCAHLWRKMGKSFACQWKETRSLNPKVKCVLRVTPVFTSPQHCSTAAALNYGCGTAVSFWSREE